MNDNHPHFPSLKLPIRQVVENEIATIYFYEHLVILEVAEGVSLTYKNGATLLFQGLKIMGTRPFVIISNRKNSYSLNPTDYKHLEIIPTLKGIAVVSHRESTKKNALLESGFFKKPFEVFESIPDAHTWAKEILAH